MPNPKKPRSKCLSCNNEPDRADYKYCSNLCQHEYQYTNYIHRWKAGKETGMIKTGVVSAPVKRYLREKFGNKCFLCNWAAINPKTGLVPVVADHIDGNWRNNSEDNLRLLCPNCDSLQPTFAALNKGNGRAHRVESKRYKEAKRIFSRKQR